MKELNYLNIINNVLSDSSFLGDDCALLEEFGLYITQDTLVEDVHFSLDTITPFLLGKKTINVNLSDLAAVCADPLYITISLSLPNDLSDKFVEYFYRGVDSVCMPLGVKVVGGDLTASSKAFISVCAIGRRNPLIKVSRSFAQVGDFVVTTGFHGDSAGGLRLLMANKNTSQYLIDKHLSPVAQLNKSKKIADALSRIGVTRFAMMDTSDGLGDAIYKMSKASSLALSIDTIPASCELKSLFPDDWSDIALWGGEDFELLCCIPENAYELLDKSEFYKIGVVKDIPFDEKFLQEFESKSFKHFE